MGMDDYEIKFFKMLLEVLERRLKNSRDSDNIVINRVQLKLIVIGITRLLNSEG